MLILMGMSLSWIIVHDESGTAQTAVSGRGKVLARLLPGDDDASSLAHMAQRPGSLIDPSKRNREMRRKERRRRSTIITEPTAEEVEALREIIVRHRSESDLEEETGAARLKDAAKPSSEVAALVRADQPGLVEADFLLEGGSSTDDITAVAAAVSGRDPAGQGRPMAPAPALGRMNSPNTLIQNVPSSLDV